MRTYHRSRGATTVRGVASVLLSAVTASGSTPAGRVAGSGTQGIAVGGRCIEFKQLTENPSLCLNRIQYAVPILLKQRARCASFFEQRRMPAPVAALNKAGACNSGGDFQSEKQSKDRACGRRDT